jgi:hypothetical protein
LQSNPWPTLQATGFSNRRIPGIGPEAFFRALNLIFSDDKKEKNRQDKGQSSLLVKIARLFVLFACWAQNLVSRIGSLSGYSCKIVPKRNSNQRPIDLMVCLVSWGNAQIPAKTIPIRIPLLCTIRKIGNLPKAPFEGRV